MDDSAAPTTMNAPSLRPRRTLAEALAGLVLCAQIAGMALWWWISPGGFPFAHPRFWSNSVLPVAVIGVAVAGIIGRQRNHRSLFRLSLLTLAVFWTTAVISGCALFPISAGRFALPGIAGLTLLWAASALELLRLERTERLRALAAVCVMAIAGALLPFTQRAPEPETHPLNELMSPMPAHSAGLPSPVLAPLGPRAAVVPAEGMLSIEGSVALHVRPLLTFDSISPDRCWTILAPRSATPAPPQLVTGRIVGPQVWCTYRGLAEERLHAEVDRESREYLLEVTAQLDQPVFSHLNSFTEFAIRGTAPLRLSFSPCGDEWIDIVESDYPAGRPARFACVDASRTFRVVEASSGEKGPFRTLAAGSLPLGGPLTITIWNGDQAAYRLTWTDWSAQAATALSPTAGWRVPVNAIEFGLIEGSGGKAANVWMTLAGTSVGRGWDSVGHAAGVYRNRVKIERLLE